MKHCSLPFRPPTDRERHVIERLLQPSFPGRDELLSQYATCRVKSIDGLGSIEFEVTSSVRAVAVKHRVPSEGEASDVDGVAIRFLLHVVNNVLHELEVYKEDNSTITRLPDPEEIVVFAPNGA